jgi:hypothetical protein
MPAMYDWKTPSASARACVTETPGFNRATALNHQLVFSCKSCGDSMVMAIVMSIARPG